MQRTHVSLPTVAAENSYRRAERIAAVLFVLLGHVDERSALKKSVIDTVSDVLSSIVSLGNGYRSSGHQSVEDIEVSVRVLGTHIRLAVVSGHLSQQNAEILLAALEEMVAYIRSVQQSIHADRVTITRSDLLPLEQTSVPMRLKTTAGNTGDRGGENALAASVSNGKQTTPVAAIEIHSSRQEVILALLKKSGPLGIRDIAAHIPDCGEKTVQRELASMVASGALKKEGEKRWSQYTIAIP